MAYNLAIAGGAGRMGKLLIAQAARSAIFEISGVLDREETLAQIRDQLKRNQSDNATVSASPQEAFAQADLVVDFSIAEAVALNAKTAAEQDSAYLVGVTGLDETATTALKTAAQKVAVLHASNVSTGVAVLALLVRQAATLLDESWDVEVLEMHHRYKSDAPSGTALRLGEQVAKGRGLPADAVAQSAKNPSRAGTRKQGSIGFAVLRGGTVAGDHAVIFAGEEERLTLSHSPGGRGLYAKGALRLAAWLVQQPAGFHTTEEIFKSQS